MKTIFFACILTAAATFAHAQKKDPVVKSPAVNAANAKLVNAKLLKLQATLKQMETKLNEVKELMGQVEKDKAGLSELGQEDMLMLQQLMEKKSQLESMISNVMKASYEAGQKAVQSLKAS